MSVVSFNILLTRNSSSDNDDVITIAPTGLGNYRIDYRSKPENTRHFIYCERDNVIRYVEDLFYLLPSDTQPFSHIQFNFPCFPLVIYKVTDVNSNVIRQSVLFRLRELLDNWPEKRVSMLDRMLFTS
jgi:hypothetical protein